MMSSDSAEQDLDQVTFFIYPDSEALKGEFTTGDMKLSEEFVNAKLKALWNSEIKPKVDSLSHSYFWHDEGIHWEYIDHAGSPFNSFFNGKVKFGDGMEDEWFVLQILMEITKINTSLICSIFDSDGDFVLIEAAEVLPSWLEPECSKNRVFVHEGMIKVIPIEDFPKTPSIQDALKYLRSARCSVDMNIQRIISAKLEQQNQLHYTRVRIPLKVAQVLHSDARLVGPAISAFYHRDPDSVRICTEMPRFNPGGNGGDLVLTTIPMTRIQFAQLACQEFLAPSNDRVNFDLSSCDLLVAAELGMKLTCGFEMLMASSAQKFITKNLFETNVSVQGQIEEILKNQEIPQNVINDRPEDSLDWMRLDEGTLESELQDKFESFSMNEDEKSALLDTWTREFDNESEKVDGMKNELSEIDSIVEKMKKMIESTSNFEGIENDNDSENDSDNDCSVDSENDEEEEDDFIEREIFETINYDPDLFMKILEVNSNMGVCNEEFIQKFRKYQQDNNNASGIAAINGLRQKGLADIDAAKVAEARISSRKVFDEEIVDNEETLDNNSDSENEIDEKTKLNSQSSASDSDNYDEEFIFGTDSKSTVKHQEVESSDSSDYEEYYSAMDVQLQKELNEAVPGFFDESGLITNLGKNVIESMAAVKGTSSTSPIETVLSALGKKLPKNQ